MMKKHAAYDLLLRHRHQSADPLVLELPIDRLQDQEYCRSLVDRLRSAGEEWEVLTATPETYNLIPKGRGIYMFVWRTSFDFVRENSKIPFFSVLYIGKSNSLTYDLQARYRGEYAKLIQSRPDDWWSNSEPRDRVERLSRLFSLADLEYWFLVIEGDDAPIDNLETELIRLLNPPGNVQGKSFKSARLVRGKPEPAF